jgi:small subunit ribosomal protein S17
MAQKSEKLGVVVGNKMQKTVIVAVEKHKRHPLYNKIIRRTKRYKAHDEKGLCALGDTVRIIESRPLPRSAGGWSDNAPRGGCRPARSTTLSSSGSPPKPRCR